MPYILVSHDTYEQLKDICDQMEIIAAVHEDWLDHDELLQTWTNKNKTFESTGILTVGFVRQFKKLREKLKL